MRSNDRATHGPRARRLGTSIPATGCRNGCEATAGQAKRQANTAPGLLSPQPGGLKPFVDFCGVARSGETAAGIAQRSRLQKSANGIQRPSWDLISASLNLRPLRFQLSAFPPVQFPSGFDLQGMASGKCRGMHPPLPVGLNGAEQKSLLPAGDNDPLGIGTEHGSRGTM